MPPREGHLYLVQGMSVGKDTRTCANCYSMLWKDSLSVEHSDSLHYYCASPSRYHALRRPQEYLKIASPNNWIADT